MQQNLWMSTKTGLLSLTVFIYFNIYVLTYIHINTRASAILRQIVTKLGDIWQNIAQISSTKINYDKHAQICDNDLTSRYSQLNQI